MPTPLYDRLKSLAAEHPLRFDMPGHHGVLRIDHLGDFALDFTENGETGDLFGPGGDAIEAAERLWAQRFGLDSCLFLTGGSTQGMHTGLALLAGTGNAVALDGGSHRSAYHALALLDLTPYYLLRPWLDREGVTGPIQPEAVEQVLNEHPEVKTICITSPTYYGVLSDLPAIARICHDYGAKLMVDGAHGAHLPFLGYEGYRAADVVVVSAHKTLPALGQSALLFANGLSLAELRRIGSVYGSSSPSYLLMAGLDVARDYMEREGVRRYEETARQTARLRRRFPALCPGQVELDPARLTIRCADGFAMAEALRRKRIFPEMADRGHVVFILTCADDQERLSRLEQALEGLGVGKEETGTYPPPPEPPQRALTPRRALFASRRTVPLNGSEGQICAGQIVPYPPGVPVVAPGERLEKKHLVYLKEIGYNKDDTTTEVVYTETEKGDHDETDHSHCQPR